MNIPAALSTSARLNWRFQPWLALALIALAIMLVPLPPAALLPPAAAVRIAASQYQFSPAVIYANPGDRVTIELVATDVVHGLYVDGYDLEITADPGQTAVLSFVANKSGTFRLRCSVACGPLHPFMIGKLKVGRNALLWRGSALALLAAIGGLWRLRR